MTQQFYFYLYTQRNGNGDSDNYMPMFTAEYSQQPKCGNISNVYHQMNKQNVAYEYNGIYSAIKMTEVFAHATIQMNFESIVLSEIRQTHFHSYEVSRIDKFIEIENKLEDTGAGGSENVELLFNGYSFYLQ